MEKIRIKYHADIQKLEKISQGDWIDLRAAEDMFVPLGEYRMISLGVSMQLPKGYEAHVVPRSSTFKKWGVLQTNSFGVIDNTYCGDNDVWHFPALCTVVKCHKNGKPGTIIHKGDRICQFRIMKIQPEIEFTEVEVLGNKDRSGFGSTGSN